MELQSLDSGIDALALAQTSFFMGICVGIVIAALIWWQATKGRDW
ncbi:MAG: hypothetical protein QM612_02270 [Thermomonas sp.]